MGGEQTGDWLVDPPKTGFAITPSDVSNLAKATRGIWIGTGGDLKVDYLDGTTATLKNIPSGYYKAIRVKRVYATGTTASDLVGEA